MIPPDASARCVRLILYGRNLSSSNLAAPILAFYTNPDCFHSPLKSDLTPTAGSENPELSSKFSKTVSVCFRRQDVFRLGTSRPGSCVALDLK